ncbi:MAG TPA: patatin-like phospholipase family protein [Janthinobacterium sp.]|nr:patatin-like phospholipase family protein [Janthinobacterium sp.]
MVMAGGGFRFGIYLGMYEAMRQSDRAPDLLLASCGGSLAATVIQSLPDDASRRAWLYSPGMYRFWCALKSAPQANLARTLWRAARRAVARGNAAVIPDLFQDYLFELAPQLPFPPVSAQSETDLAIIGGKLLFSEREAGQPRGRRKLFAETLFCPPRAAALVQGMVSPLSDPRWGEHAVASDLLTDAAMAPADAARISISDMFYFPPPRVGDEHYIGGVIDLFPVELARRLADEVILEFKEAFDQTFAIPAWRSVLGLDGNQRLRYANGQPADIRIDASDVSSIEEPMQQKLDWRRNRIDVIMPADHATFVRHMEAQWEYGFQRGMEACARQAGQPLPAMRNASRHSKALV